MSIAQNPIQIYKLREKFFSTHTSFTITEIRTSREFTAKSRLISYGKIVDVFRGDFLALSIQQQFALVLPKYKVVLSDGRFFTIQRIMSLQHNYRVTGLDLQLTGDFLGHCYSATSSNGQRLFDIKKELNTWGNVYDVKVYQEEMGLISLGTAIAVDLAIAAIQK